MEQKIKRTAIVSRSTAAGRERKGKRESVCVSVCVLAPREPLERWAKRDKNGHKVGKTRRKSTAEALLASCSWCCARAFIVQTYLQSRLSVRNNEKMVV